ncbi:MAG: hypothetical protein KGL10_04720 [Alphaproteobacteria bacterium]|nr:hypothetical protein [Alphaproteobacteria bacterium]MDE2336593.1 hypothetical protein [Alphaproteobacteria bacterium]
METVQSSSKVQKIRDDAEGFRVSFSGHSGYFRVAKTPETRGIREKIIKAHTDGAEITFDYDRNLTIINVL